MVEGLVFEISPLLKQEVEKSPRCCMEGWRECLGGNKSA